MYLRSYVNIKYMPTIIVAYSDNYDAHNIMYVDVDSLVVSKEEFEDYDDVGKAFIVLQTNMRALLRNADCVDLRRACIAQMRNPGGAELSQELVKEISKTQNTDNLFDLLVPTPYWSWIDI